MDAKELFEGFSEAEQAQVYEDLAAQGHELRVVTV